VSRLRGFRWTRRLIMPHTPPMPVGRVHYNLRARVLLVAAAVAKLAR
jgi:hypothetical protein